MDDAGMVTVLQEAFRGADEGMRTTGDVRELRVASCLWQPRMAEGIFGLGGSGDSTAASARVFL